MEAEKVYNLSSASWKTRTFETLFVSTSKGQHTSFITLIYEALLTPTCASCPISQPGYNLVL